MKTRFLATALCVLGGALVTTPGCSAKTNAATGVGDPCTPGVEADGTFLGFNENEVNFEAGSPTCATSICLVNHFRGRVSCPYGQSADGSGPVGGQACATTKGAPVTGGPSSALKKAQVAPQCVDRAADKAVYCSCRCANANGRTDDAGVYCACPSGFECTSVITSIGPSTNDVAGSYCVKSGTAYDRNTACNQGDCDPVARKCGS